MATASLVVPNTLPADTELLQTVLGGEGLEDLRLSGAVRADP